MKRHYYNKLSLALCFLMVFSVFVPVFGDSLPMIDGSGNFSKVSSIIPEGTGEAFKAAENQGTAATAAYLKNQPAPQGLKGVAPTSLANNDGKITGTTPAMEYKRLSETRYKAVTGWEIRGLSAGTYQVRYAAKPGYNAGTPVTGDVPAFVPPKKDQPAPLGLKGVAPTSAANNDGKITGTTAAMEYKHISETKYKPATEPEITGLPAGTYQVRYAAKPGYNAGAVVTGDVPAYVPPKLDQPAPTGLIGIAPTSPANRDGRITGTTSAMEYKLSTDTKYKAVWGSQITRLYPGTYQVRYAAKPGYNAGAAADVTVQPYALLDQPAPTGLKGIAPTSAANNDGKITGTTFAMEYKLSTDSRFKSVRGFQITKLTPGTYMVRYQAKWGYNAGAIAEVVIPAYMAPNQDQPAPTGLAGVAPSAALNDGRITGATPAMEYKLLAAPTYTAVTGNDITGLVAGTYQVRYAAKAGFNAGADAEVIVPAYVAPNQDQPAPTGLNGIAPTAALNDGSITGTTAAMEYKAAADSTYTAVTGAEITGLVAGTYQVRYAAKAGFNAGADADVVVPAYVAPNQDQPAPTGLTGVAPTAALNDGSITGTTAAMEYKATADSIYTAVTGTEITGLVAGTYQVRYAAKAGFNAGADADVIVPAYVPPNQDQPAPTGLLGVAPTAALNDGSITGTTAAMEYKLSTDITYTPVTGTEITGLVSGSYQVRYAAKTGFNAGADADVVVPAYVAPNQDQPAPTGLLGVAPTAALNDGVITGTTSEMEYKLSTDTTYTAITGTEITGLVAGTYQVRYAAKAGFNAGADADVIVPAYVAPNQDQPAPTGLLGVAPTAALNDGSITGTTSEMEYKLSSDSTYTAVTGTEITGLVAGTYQVRYAAKAGFNAGADAEVIVPPYVAPNQDQPAPTGLVGVAPTAALNDGSITGTTAAMEYKAAADSTYTPVTGTEITGLAAGTYQVRYAAKAGFNAGADADVVVPAYVAPNQDQPAPTGLTGIAPTAALNDGSITGTTAAMEYKAAADTTYTAVTGTEVTGLVAGTYQVRYSAKAGFNAGADADVIVPAYVAPNQDQPAPTGLLGVAPTAALNDGSITGTTTAMEYKLSTDTAYTPVTGIEITGLVAGTYQVRYSAKTGFNAGADANVVVPAYVAPNQDQPAPTGLLGVAPTAALNDGSITGTTTAMEYKAAADTAYSAVTGTEITGLVAGTYQVRYAAKAGFNAGADADVVVPAYVAPNQDQPAPTGLAGVAPTAALNDGSITGTTAAMEYKAAGDSTYTSVTGTEITGLVSGTYQVRYAAKAGFNAGADADVIVPAYVAPNQDQPAPTGLLGVAPSAALNDGVITGTTSEMEYKLSSDSTYTAVAGTEITGLVAGTYQVRYAAKTGFNAGADADVVVPAYVAPNQDQPAPTGLAGVAPTVALNDGSITGTTAAMEYKAAADSIYTAVTGTEITGLVAGTYQVRYTAKPGFNAGADADVVVPAYVAPNQDQPAPTGLLGVAPTAALNDGMITGATTAMEYKATADSTYTAVTGTEITGLSAGTYQVRYAAKPGFNAGADADVVVPAYVAPNQDQPAPTGLTGVAPTAALNDGMITGTTAAMEYKAVADLAYTSVTGTEITGLTAGTYQVRYAAKPGFNAGADADVVVPAYVAPNQDQPAPTGLTGVAPTAALNDGSITGTTAAMEYKAAADTTYTAVSGTEITGLVAGTYQVRYAAKPGFNAGADANIIVPVYVAPNQDQAAPVGLLGVAPTAALNDGSITGTTAAMEYKLSSDTTYTAVTGTAITGLGAGTYHVRYAAKAGFNAGADADVVVPAYVAPNQDQPAPTGLTGVAPTAALNNGSIAGTTAAMEYKAAADSTYTPVTGTEITGLVAGTYHVRYAAKAGFNAGADASVIVPAFVKTLVSIAITSPAAKAAYTVGEPLDITGMVITGTYSDGSTQVETVTAADVTGFDSTAPAASQLLTVTIGGKTATYTVSISAAAQWPVEVESVNVFVEMFSGLTFVNIDVKAQYAGLVNQVLVNGIAANKMPGVNQWRISVPAGTTLASLQGNITIVQFADLIGTATASRDFFGTTYVRVTMKPGITSTSVKANTVALTFNAGAGRWEGIFNTLNAGSPVIILATDGTGQTHQMTILVTQL